MQHDYPMEDLVKRVNDHEADRWKRREWLLYKRWRLAVKAPELWEAMIDHLLKRAEVFNAEVINGHLKIQTIERTRHGAHLERVYPPGMNITVEYVPDTERVHLAIIEHPANLPPGHKVISVQMELTDDGDAVLMVNGRPMSYVVFAQSLVDEFAEQ
jgi:hypothetical protein